MADVLPFRALYYDLARVGGLGPVAAPPYDVIDADQRAALIRRSPYNVVEVDLPQDHADPYGHAAAVMRAWTAEGVLVRDAEPALWALAQDYTGPDGQTRMRHGIFARVRVEEYGPGRIRPHERTHPGPKEDRLRLTRATRANLSPIFSLYDDPGGAAWAAVAPHTERAPWGEVAEKDGTAHRLWRVAAPDALDAVHAALADAELLIADGHHRYETARIYARERGAPPGARYVLMCLVALQDPGLTVFPTHRLLTGLDAEQRARLDEALARDWEATEVAPEALDREVDGGAAGDAAATAGGSAATDDAAATAGGSAAAGDAPATAGGSAATDDAPATAGGSAAADAVRVGFHDRRRSLLLTLRDQAIADAALPGKPAAYRRLDTAVLEALILKGALGMTEDDISHLRGLDYARTAAEARARVDAGTADAAFLMRATPVAQVRDVAAEGENMPPKSTYFYPKVLTGMVFNPLQEE